MSNNIKNQNRQVSPLIDNSGFAPSIHQNVTLENESEDSRANSNKNAEFTGAVKIPLGGIGSTDY